MGVLVTSPSISSNIQYSGQRIATRNPCFESKQASGLERDFMVNFRFSFLSVCGLLRRSQPMLAKSHLKGFRDPSQLSILTKRNVLPKNPNQKPPPLIHSLLYGEHVITTRSKPRSIYALYSSRLFSEEATLPLLTLKAPVYLRSTHLSPLLPFVR